MKKNSHIFTLLLILISVIAHAQCGQLDSDYWGGSSTAGTGASQSKNINGVITTITTNQNSSIYSYYSPSNSTKCTATGKYNPNFSVNVGDSGQNGIAKSTFSFDNPVNDVVLFFANIEGNEKATISVNSGTLTLTNIVSCNSALSGNEISATQPNNISGFMQVRIHSTTPFTSVTINATGNFNTRKGIDMAICELSVNTVPQCNSSPTLIKSYTTSAVGKGSAGLPPVSFDVPQTGTGKRFLMLFMTFERDDTPSPYGDNNESVLTGTIGDNITLMPIVKYGGVTMTKGTFLSSADQDTGHQYNFSYNYLTLCNYIYFLPESSLATISNNMFDLTSFSLPKNAGDEVKITIALFDYVKGMDSSQYGSYNFYDVGYVNSASFGSSDNLTSYKKTVPMLSGNQPTGVTQDKNILLAYVANSSDTGLNLTTSSWNTIEKSSVFNANGTYASDPNRTIGTSENDGITTGLFSLTGVTGSQTITLTTNSSKKTIGGLLMMRLYGDSYVAPTVKNLINTCPSLTVNLNDAHTGTIPTGAELLWYTNSNHTGTALTAFEVASAGAGTYYAFYSSSDCWSNASATVTVTITSCSSCPEPTSYTHETIKNGAWSSASTWLGGNIPNTNIGIGNSVLITHNVTRSGDFKPSSNSILVVKNGGTLNTGQIQTDNGNAKIILNGGYLNVTDGNFQITTATSSVCSVNSCIYVNNGSFQFEQSGTNMYFENTGIELRNGNLQSKANVTGANIKIKLSNGNLERNGGTWLGSTVSQWYASGGSSGFSGLPKMSRSSILPCSISTSICTKPATTGTPAGYTKVGITVQQKQAAWPENIPNGWIALESKEKGMVITRVQNSNTIAEAKEGMLIYDIDAQCVKLYNGTTWNCLERSCNE